MWPWTVENPAQRTYWTVEQNVALLRGWIWWKDWWVFLSVCWFIWIHRWYHNFWFQGFFKCPPGVIPVLKKTVGLSTTKRSSCFPKLKNLSLACAWFHFWGCDSINRNNLGTQMDVSLDHPWNGNICLIAVLLDHQSIMDRSTFTFFTLHLSSCSQPVTLPHKRWRVFTQEGTSNGPGHGNFHRVQRIHVLHRCLCQRRSPAFRPRSRRLAGGRSTFEAWSELYFWKYLIRLN